MRRPSILLPLLWLGLLLVGGCASTLPVPLPATGGTFHIDTPVRFQLQRRDFLLHIPPNYTPGQPWPLVIVLHGAFSTAAQTEQESGFSALADRERFLVAYPEGIGLFGYLQHWNAGHCCGKAAEDRIDDVGFIVAVLETVERVLAVDRTRVYLVGMSNGGMLTHRFAAERGELLSAAAVVSGALGSSLIGTPEWHMPEASTPLSLLMIHGDADRHIPPQGGSSPLPGRTEQRYLSLQEAVDYWRRADSCSALSKHETDRAEAVDLLTWADCRNGSRVTRILLQDWGHQWPTSPMTTRLPDDAPLHGYDAGETIWRFFQHSPPTVIPESKP